MATVQDVRILWGQMIWDTPEAQAAFRQLKAEAWTRFTEEARAQVQEETQAQVREENQAQVREEVRAARAQVREEAREDRERLLADLLEERFGAHADVSTVARKLASWSASASAARAILKAASLDELANMSPPG